MDDQRTERKARTFGSALSTALGVVAAVLGALLLGITLCSGVIAALRGDLSRDFAFAVVLTTGFVSCWIIAMISFSKAYSNMQPGMSWWKFMRTPIKERREHPERFFMPEGVFWMKVAMYAVLLGFAVAAMVSVAARSSR